MSLYIKEQHVKRFYETCKENPLQKHLYEVLRARTLKNTKEDTLVQQADTQEWYHLVWERMSDAAFLYHMERDQRLGKWIHDRTMEIVERPADDWIGPWYRTRNAAYQQSTLETAHIILAVCEAYINVSELFSEQETVEIRAALKEKGMIPCRRFLDVRWSQGVGGTWTIGNWSAVALNGYGTAAVVLGEEAEREHLLELEVFFSRMYNRDSYGESQQYSNYASLHLSYLHRVLMKAGWAEMSQLHTGCYVGLTEWYVYNFQRMKYVPEYEAVLPRSFAFGDSSNLFRPTADILARIAVWAKRSHPKEAGLAAWLLQTIYREEKGLPDELATFGFLNQFAYDTILMLPDMAEPITPREAGLPLRKEFEVGHIIARDDWQDAKMSLALAAGYKPLRVSGHRHRDQNSFQLSVGAERMLIDPGHCCYRLAAQKKSMDESSHNMIYIRYKDNVLQQKTVREGNVWEDRTPGNQLLVLEEWKGMTIVVSDASDMYEQPVERAVRIWIFRLPYGVWVIDRVLAKEPVILGTSLVLNNRDNCLKTEVITAGEMLFQRKEESLHARVLSNQVDGTETEVKLKYDWTYLHDYYHPLPNQAGQGKEGSALTYIWEDTKEGLCHSRIQLLTSDKYTDWEWVEKVQCNLGEQELRITLGGEQKKFILD